MVSGLSDAPLGSPGSWEGIDATDGYHYGSDSGSSSSIENLHTSTEPTMYPGEIWQFKVRLSLSSEPTAGSPVFIEIRDEPSNNILARSAIPDYGGNETVLFATLPTYKVNGDSTSPAGGQARPDVRVNNVGGATFNYFVEVYAVRLRDEIDQSQRTEDTLNYTSPDSLNSGSL